jgi:phosphoribosylcarboxyaminoimidazole (NCAIR) mutase
MARSHALRRKPLVAILMGSESDLVKMARCAQVLEEYAVPYCVRVLSAHRTPLGLAREGAANAGHLAAAVLALGDARLRQRLRARRASMAREVIAKNDGLEQKLKQLLRTG